jgi:hypothetical protein
MVKSTLLNKIIFTCFAWLPMHCARAQKVFSVPYPSQADVKVFLVKYESQAELCVFREKNASAASGNEGHWHFTRYPAQADLKVYFVAYEAQADLKVYFVPYPSKAGWKKREKMHLLQ